MIVIRNRILPFGKKYYAINICGIVFAKGPCDKYDLNHEAIHSAQIIELLVVGFYLWYGVEWLIRSISRRSFYQGYKNISFEREAYTHGDDLTYLKSRRLFNFLKFY